MPRDLTIIEHASWLALTLSSLLWGCGATDAERMTEMSSIDTGLSAPTIAQALRAGAGLTLTGNSTLSPLVPESGYGHEFNGNFFLANHTGRPVTISKQLFFFAAPGGYAYGAPNFDTWWPTLPAASTPQGVGTFGWGWSAPVSHLVVRVDGRTDLGTSVAALAAIPVIASGRPSPAASPYTDDTVVGVQSPIEILNLTSGERWLPVTGTVVDTTGTATSDPSLTVLARNGSGSSIGSLSTAFGPAEVPIRRFIAWNALSAGVSVASLRITASYSTSNGIATQIRDIPVVNANPPAMTSPVSGSWMWANGPGEPVWQTHTGGPESRYAYDLGIHRLVNGVLQSYSGDPALNSSYFCWDQPIRVPLDGTVRRVVSNLPDNNGSLHDNDQGNNEIIVEHANGLFSRFAHIRQNTATVQVGQVVYAGSVIGLVGNAGASSEPHLHFHVFKIDATGRQQAVPVLILKMKSSSGTPVSGIPKGGFIYQTE